MLGNNLFIKRKEVSVFPQFAHISWHECNKLQLTFCFIQPTTKVITNNDILTIITPSLVFRKNFTFFLEISILWNAF